MSATHMHLASELERSEYQQTRLRERIELAADQRVLLLNQIRELKRENNALRYRLEAALRPRRQGVSGFGQANL